MDSEQRLVYIKSQIVCAEAELLGMKAANEERLLMGYSAAYNESDFNNVPEKYGITHNQVISYLVEG